MNKQGKAFLSAFVGACALLATPLLCTAQEGAPQVSIEQLATQQALQFSLLGKPAELDALARSREIEEKNQKRNGQRPLILSDNIALLSGAIQPRVRSKSTTKNLLQNFKQDGETEQLFALVDQVNPREQFARARSNQRYESARRQVNSFTGAIFSVLQLQLFGLLQPPLDFAEWYTVGRKTLNPEQRREFAEARSYLNTNPPIEEQLKPKAERVVQQYPTKRLRTATLQAERNAQRELKEGNIYNALWWFDRELLLTNQETPQRKAHLELIQQLQREAEGRERSISIQQSADDAFTGSVSEGYNALLEAVLLQTPYAELGIRYSSLSALEGTVSPLLADEYVLVQTTALAAEGNTLKARELLEWFAKNGSGFWAERSVQYLNREDFNPAVGFAQANADYRRSVRRYLVYAESPRFPNRHLSSENARELETGWTRSIRSLFVIDIMSRAIILPLLPGSTFSRDAWLNTYGNLSEAELNSQQGREWKEQTLRAFRKMKRWESASNLANELGQPKNANKYANRWVEQELERIDGRTPEVRLEQLIALQENAPTSQARQVAEQALLNEQARQNVLAVLDRKYVKNNPDDWRKSMLNIPPEWTDGKKANGEIGSEGLYLVEGDQVRFKNKADGEWLTYNVTPGSVLNSVRLIYPRRRADDIEEFMNQPQEKKRIPIQVEGSAFPGINVLPGLVPLDPEQKRRRLYL